MASEKIKKILSEDGVREARGELAAFFRKILQDIRMRPIKWEYLLNSYLEKYETKSSQNSKDRSYARGNLNTQFTADTMTWRTFMDAIRFLNPFRMKITFEFEWARGVTTQHSMNFRMRHDGDDISTLEDPSASPSADITGVLPESDSSESKVSSKDADPSGV